MTATARSRPQKTPGQFPPRGGSQPGRFLGIKRIAERIPLRNVARAHHRPLIRGKEDVMRAERLIPQTAWFFSLLLGQASILLGLMVALGWAFAFTLIVPQRAVGWAAGAHGTLPIEPPLI